MFAGACGHRASVRLGVLCAGALCAVLSTGTAPAQALPVCGSGYAPTAVAGTSNAASASTALTVAWDMPAGAAEGLEEEKIGVWPAGESREDGRQALTRETGLRSFVFNNGGEDGEVAAGSEPGWIEPNTAYDVAVTAVYGASAVYPEGCSVETKGTSPVTTRRIFGTNSGLCCSVNMPEALVKNAETLVADGITSDRVEMSNDPETEAEESYGNTPKMAHEHNFVNNDVVVGNVSDTEHLSEVSVATWVKETTQQIERASTYGDVLMEVGNEMWLKGDGNGCYGPECAEPDKYAEMFVGLSKEVDKAKEAGAIPHDVRLLFDLTGDYYLGNGKWSNATEQRGWLGDAIAAQPELKTRIEGFTFHPYDPGGETLAEEEEQSIYGYDYGLRGLKGDYAEAVELGVKHTNVYATEFGACSYVLIEGECRKEGTQKTEAEATKAAETDYNELLSSQFPEVKGLWWYAAYPGEAQWYSFFQGWGGGEETELLSFASKLSRSSAPTVNTTAASGVGAGDATLNAVVNPGGAETSCYFEYGTTEAYGSKTAEVSGGSGVSDVEVSTSISGLTAGTKYYFRIVATNRNGTSDGSAEAFTGA